MRSQDEWEENRKSLDRLLAGDPETVAAFHEGQARGQEEAKLALKEAAPLFEELRRHGLITHTISELGHPRTYESHVPLLCDWLVRAESEGLRIDIMRALSYRWSTEELRDRVVDVVLDALECPDRDTTYVWHACQAIADAADRRHLHVLERLAVDTSLGGSRSAVIPALGRYRGTSEQFLLDLLDNDDAAVQEAAAEALGKRHVVAAVPRLQALAGSPHEVVRESARQALIRLS